MKFFITIILAAIVQNVHSAARGALKFVSGPLRGVSRNDAAEIVERAWRITDRQLEGIIGNDAQRAKAAIDAYNGARADRLWKQPAKSRLPTLLPAAVDGKLQTRSNLETMVPNTKVPKPPPVLNTQTVRGFQST